MSVCTLQLSVVLTYDWSEGSVLPRLRPGVKSDFADTGLRVPIASASQAGCRSLILRKSQAHRLGLAQAFVTRETTDPDNLRLHDVNRSLSVADWANQQVLKCSPTDGAAWLRLASFEALGSGLGPLAVRAVSLSQTYSPYEGPILRSRLSFLRQYPIGSVETFREVERIKKMDGKVLAEPELLDE